jgi:hypothetical protein
MSFKTTLSAVKVPATVLSDVDRVFVVNATPRGATLVVFRHQVALRLQVAVEVGGLAVILTSPLSWWTRVCSQPVPSRHTTLTWPCRTSTYLAI